MGGRVIAFFALCVGICIGRGASGDFNHQIKTLEARAEYLEAYLVRHYERKRTGGLNDQELQAALSAVTFGEPLRTMLKPSISVRPDAFDLVNAWTGQPTPTAKVIFTFNYHAVDSRGGWPTATRWALVQMVDRSKFLSHDDVHQYAYQMMKTVLLHEGGESFRVNGVLTHDPHAGEPGAPR